MQRNNIQAAGNVWPELSIKTEKRKPNNTSGLRGTFSSIGRVTLRSEPSQPLATLKRPKCATSLQNLFLVGGEYTPGQEFQWQRFAPSWQSRR